jgi:hypothetical protein
MNRVRRVLKVLGIGLLVVSLVIFFVLPTLVVTAVVDLIWPNGRWPSGALDHGPNRASAGLSDPAPLPQTPSEDPGPLGPT